MSPKPGPSALDRHKAALKVASVFRGHLARKEYEGEQRKALAIRREEEEAQREASLPRPKALVRPKGKSYCGF